MMTTARIKSVEVRMKASKALKGLGCCLQDEVALNRPAIRANPKYLAVQKSLDWRQDFLLRRCAHGLGSSGATRCAE
jgi:hypothetical protein